MCWKLLKNNVQRDMLFHEILESVPDFNPRWPQDYPYWVVYFIYSTGPSGDNKCEWDTIHIGDPCF